MKIVCGQGSARTPLESIIQYPRNFATLSRYRYVYRCPNGQDNKPMFMEKTPFAFGKFTDHLCISSFCIYSYRLRLSGKQYIQLPHPRRDCSCVRPSHGDSSQPASFPIHCSRDRPSKSHLFRLRRRYSLDDRSICARIEIHVQIKMTLVTCWMFVNTRTKDNLSDCTICTVSVFYNFVTFKRIALELTSQSLLGHWWPTLSQYWRMRKQMNVTKVSFMQTFITTATNSYLKYVIILLHLITGLI